MFIPVGTDAPIYHWPFITALLITANIAGFLFQCAVPESTTAQRHNDPPMVMASLLNPQEDLFELDLNKNDKSEEAEESIEDWNFDDIEHDFDDSNEDFDEEGNWIAKRNKRSSFGGWKDLCLTHGDGLHPIQWITSNFMHADFLHLLGNMVFLGVFGFIVEGRLGNWQFGCYYMAIAVIQCFIEQVISLGGGEGISLGASSAIYGIMVTAMIWSPRDNINCLFFFLYRPFMFAVPVLIFGAIYVLMDLTGVAFSGSELNTSFLHLLGAGVGLVGALAALKFHWVDTEYGDVVSMAIEATGRDPEKVRPRVKSKREIREEEEQQAQKQSFIDTKLDGIWNSIDLHLNNGNTKDAIVLQRQARKINKSAKWNEPRLLKLIGKLQVQKEWDQVIFYSEEYITRFKSKEVTIRLNLAKILILQKHSPRKAIKTIKPIQTRPLDEKQKATMQQIIGKAKQQIDAGVIELGD